MQVSLIHDTCPILSKLALDFNRLNFIYIQKPNHQVHLTVSRVSDQHGSLYICGKYNVTHSECTRNAAGCTDKTVDIETALVSGLPR